MLRADVKKEACAHLLSVVDLPDDGLPTRPINGSRGMAARLQERELDSHRAQSGGSSLFYLRKRCRPRRLASEVEVGLVGFATQPQACSQPGADCQDGPAADWRSAWVQGSSCKCWLGSRVSCSCTASPFSRFGRCMSVSSLVGRVTSAPLSQPLLSVFETTLGRLDRETTPKMASRVQLAGQKARAPFTSFHER